MLTVRTKQKGFTFLELVSVIVILGIISAIAVPRFYSYKGDAKLATLKATLGNVRTAIHHYYLNKAVTEDEPRLPNRLELLTPGEVIEHEMTANPYNGKSDVNLVDGTYNATSPPVAQENRYGWNYDRTNNKFWANTTEQDANKY